MALSSGLMVKSLVGVLSIATLACSSWVLWDKGSWTELDKEVFNATSGWTWKVTKEADITAVAGAEPKLEIKGENNSASKEWKCVIKGKLPETLKSDNRSRIPDQFNDLLTAVGLEPNPATTSWTTSWTTSSLGQPQSNAAKKLFSSCIRNRTLSQWKEAKKGTRGESTIHLKVREKEEKNGSTKWIYQFKEIYIKYLYESK